uniref:Uncharacterized protein n=1 Tax=Chromera velia CCMP2878 TaxID=1169474 RepID=A0A0G4F363_9ALVE|eukprot:Cvel_14924.t1-p1 / transcript=Cvel_14924.t1 / gene=Cvel_14924 / organism=Chromera_velia_CCMP2878 / gene_product=Vacuolar-sorting receptor 6, putative / transcript_product=Vacuolar-sorting receptor 6, putative / location=Cvel_scaffold1081:30014-34259(+) / protein_length=500 / sequence_SO=supercontig / SO=protein_coding / is_pseudo=false
MGFLHLICLGLFSLAHVSRGQIRVVAPTDLKNSIGKNGSGRIQGSTAAFGTPSYGQKKIGKLVFSDSQSKHCEPDYAEEDFIKSEDAERKKDNDHPNDLEGVDKLHIVLVDRGGCTFVTKVFLAQEHYKAEAVIVVDNTGATNDGIKHTVVADDGRGNKVTIPSILITETDGDRLKEAVKKGKQDPTKQVLVELEWDVPQEDVVTVDFWSDAGKEISYKFLREFAPYAKLLGHNLRFNVHYSIYPVDKDYNSMCWTKDTDSESKFCADDPDNIGPITGEDIINEDIRQMCIMKHTASEKKELEGSYYSEKFWSYITAFYAEGSNCVKKSENSLGLRKCSEEAMSTAGIDRTPIDACIKKTQDVKTMLAEEAGNQAWGVMAIRVNGWRYKGVPEAHLVATAVCEGFTEPPAACKGIKTQVSGDSSFSVGNYLLALLVILCVVGLAFYFYQIYLQRSVRDTLRHEVMMEVKSQMADYQPLKEVDEKGGAGGQDKRGGRPLIL